MGGKIVSGILFLILVYLFVYNSSGTAKVIETLAGNAISGIKTLQGR